jgi:iron complex transport system ATP-binding protein
MTAGLTLSDVHLRRGGKPIVSGAGLTAPAGKLTGLVGPNGAGKSTLIGGIVGLERLEAGMVSFEGGDLAALGRRERARVCAYVEQSASTEERLSVRDVVALGRVGMSAFAARAFNTLSGGEQQRVHIARALAQQPRLLVLDEPTSHLDIRAQLQVLALLAEEASAGGTVLLALHDLNLALRFCDWLVVMHEGQVAAEGLPAEVLTEGLLARVYGVMARLVPGPDGPIIVYQGIA